MTQRLTSTGIDALAAGTLPTDPPGIAARARAAIPSSDVLPRFRLAGMATIRDRWQQQLEQEKDEHAEHELMGLLRLSAAHAEKSLNSPIARAPHGLLLSLLMFSTQNGIGIHPSDCRKSIRPTRRLSTGLAHTQKQLYKIALLRDAPRSAQLFVWSRDSPPAVF